MKYLDGGSLDGFLKSQGGPISMHLALQILAPAADGLEAAHARGIVHCDLKPENIFLVRRGANPHHAVVLDFGIAQMSEQVSGVRTAHGTLAYMPPEQICDRRTVDRRSDVYAIGVILYQIPAAPPSQATSLSIAASESMPWPLQTPAHRRLLAGVASAVTASAAMGVFLGVRTPRDQPRAASATTTPTPLVMEQSPPAARPTVAPLTTNAAGRTPPLDAGVLDAVDPDTGCRGIASWHSTTPPSARPVRAPSANPAKPTKPSQTPAHPRPTVPTRADDVGGDD